MDFVTDTHALIWYLEDSPRLSRAVNKIFDACDRGELVIYIPTICLVEIVYLHEKGKIGFRLKQELDRALSEYTSGLRPVPLTLDIVQTLHLISRSEVPDMPDRIIAATAKFMNLPLLTRDSRIQASDIRTVW